MSNETTNPVVKWILIGVSVVSVCVVGAFVLLGTYPAGEYRAAAELEKRGFEILYERQGHNIWKYPFAVKGEDRSITEDDCQFLCQLSHLQYLVFYRCDLSGLNLDDIGHCRELVSFWCEGVTPFPADEIRKLAVCPLDWFVFTNAHLNDSDLEDFVKWAKFQYLHLEENAEITDASFEYLEKIASLRELRLTGTSVTQEGVDEFKKKRPGVTVIF